MFGATWSNAGWQVEEVDLLAEYVTFRRLADSRKGCLLSIIRGYRSRDSRCLHLRSQKLRRTIEKDRRDP
jgi:hypothetical protein